MSNRLKNRWLWIASLAIVCLIVGSTTTVFAVSPDQVFRRTDFVNFRGACCFSFNEFVQVVEPSVPMPVVVTWSADYITTENSGGSVFAGLMVNGGPCQFYGSGELPNLGGVEVSRAFQWIVFPGDGLVPGRNTFTLCGGGGGGESPESANLSVVSNTLAVRLSK